MPPSIKRPSSPAAGSRSAGELQLRAEQAVAASLQQLATHTGVTLPPVEVAWDLKGRCAGQAVLREGRLLLRINASLLARHQEAYLAMTIPHEVAHLHLLWRYRHRRRRPRPHGPEWQTLMRECFHLPPERCHPFPTRSARTVRRNYLYRCACTEHRLTRILHNRIDRGQARACRRCGALLVFRKKLPS